MDKISFLAKVSTYHSFAQAGGSLIQLHDRVTCHIHGNISFIQNKIYYVVSGSLPFYVDGGTAISVAHRSTLVISGIASFVRNQANASTGPHVSMPFRVIGSTPDININGGAIYASYQSRVIFEETSNISFIENSATSDGGAMYIYNSNLIICGRVLFEKNFASGDGGAIAIVGGVILAVNNHNIIFRNNTSPSSGGAISSTSASVELRNILFERNTALYGGAVSAQGIHNTNYSGVELSDVLFQRNSASYGGAIYAQDIDRANSIKLRNTLFERNTAMLNGGAVYIRDSVINMTGTLHFVQNSAQRGGTIAFDLLSAFRSLLLTEPLMANFVENSATMGGGVLFFDDYIFVRQHLICDADIIDAVLINP